MLVVMKAMLSSDSGSGGAKLSEQMYDIHIYTTTNM